MNDIIEAEVLTGPQDLQAAKEAQKNLNNFIASQMMEGTDFGIIPGTKRKSLWQPGAQKLLYFNGLGCRIEPQPGCIVDFKGGFFHYEYKAVVFHKASGKVVAECVGSANSMETRYRYLWLSEKKLPRGINKDELPYEDRDGQHGPYKSYRLDNPEPQSQVNTLQKMAQKRAMIGAALLACRASENFTQDVEEEEQHQPADRRPPADPQGSSAPKSTAPSEPISEKQLKRFYALLKENEISDQSAQEYLRNTFPYTVDAEGKVHASKLAWRDYDACCKWIEGK